MADDQDQDQKTEDPSQKRLEEAHKKGNVPFSREVGNFFIMALLALIVSWFMPGMLRNAAHLLGPLLSESWNLPVDQKGLGQLLSRIALGSMGIIAVPMLCAIVAAVSGSVLQNGLVLSNEPLMPKLDRISPLAGIKRMFSLRSVVELLKGIFKIAIVGFVGYNAIAPQLTHARQLTDSSNQDMLIFLALLATRMTMGVAIAMFFIALFDLLYQRYQFTKSLRMTKQEVKDEYKQSEGDPVIKQKLRRLRQERASKRMMGNVPKADVVITNPTHFAVALQYDGASMKAPMVVAKGQDLIALRIRDLANEHKIPIVENPPLARALFSSTEIDQEIPIAQYEAVAKIISYVYQLKGKRM
jgi:flagellar biosynthetic protein FlhB